MMLVMSLVVMLSVMLLCVFGEIGMVGVCVGEIVLMCMVGFLLVLSGEMLLIVMVSLFVIVLVVFCVFFLFVFVMLILIMMVLSGMFMLIWWVSWFGVLFRFIFLIIGLRMVGEMIRSVQVCMRFCMQFDFCSSLFVFLLCVGMIMICVLVWYFGLMSWEQLQVVLFLRSMRMMIMIQWFLSDWKQFCSVMCFCFFWYDCVMVCGVLQYFIIVYVGIEGW